MFRLCKLKTWFFSFCKVKRHNHGIFKELEIVHFRFSLKGSSMFLHTARHYLLSSLLSCAVLSFSINPTMATEELNLSPSASINNEDPQLKNLQEYNVKCTQGDLNTCHELANLHLKHNLYTEAATYLDKVCFSENPNAAQACAALTTLLIYDSYNMQDLVKGQQVAEYLCNEKKTAFGCTVLSQIFFKPNNLDLNKVLEYAKKSCDLRDATGCRQTAITLYAEAFENKDLEKASEAFEYYNRACNLGDNDSCEIYDSRNEKLEQFKKYSLKTK